MRQTYRAAKPLLVIVHHLQVQISQEQVVQSGHCYQVCVSWYIGSTSELRVILVSASDELLIRYLYHMLT